MPALPHSHFNLSFSVNRVQRLCESSAHNWFLLGWQLTLFVERRKKMNASSGDIPVRYIQVLMRGC